ncbi:hypothetical protein Vadar_012802 [Vaccinium darrowii]|uniref:Uncharacterized protein n=1 Tax=Vaccinium darrowii TaxID=229202 RepID=A0ACB7ZBS4_9ERIC|nr:hypothetical protein Vadar_012802 [Vaccinium darrowii]
MAEKISNTAIKRYAIVTGANKGIGFEICRQLASNGIMVILTARDERRGTEALEKLKGSGLSDLVVFHQLDVANPSSIASLADFVKTQFGRLDILVNNAGISGGVLNRDAFKALQAAASRDKINWDEVMTQTYEMAKECLETNYYGAKRMIETFVPLLQLSNSPRIVNVSSSMGQLKHIPSERVKGVLNDAETLTEDKIDELLNEFLEDFKEKSLETKGWPTFFSANTVSKAAMNAYTRILAKTYPTFRINCVCPGYVKTDINDNSGISSVEEGAEHPVRLALLPDNGPTGVFFFQKELTADKLTVHNTVKIRTNARDQKQRQKHSFVTVAHPTFSAMAETRTATNRFAVVTGANKGIGFEICRQLASNGIMVVLTARDEKRGTEALEILKGSGLSDLVVFHQLDVANTSSIASLADFVKTHFGRLDILVNNAGISGALINWDAFKATGAPAAAGSRDQINWNELMSQTYELAKECLETNYYGAKGMIEAFIPLLQLSDSPRIVNVSSGMGKLKNIPSERVKGVLNDAETLTEEKIDELLNEFLEDFKEKSLEAKGWPAFSSAYIVSKAAMNAYTRILAKKYPTFRINCVCPGYVKTDINNNTGIYCVEEGAEHPVRLALLPDDGPTGVFFVQKEVSSFVGYAVVTGANKGIGFEICRQLASNGISVVLTARDEKRGSEALEKLRGSGLSDLVVFHQLDVVEPSTIASLADFVTTQFGRLDILVLLKSRLQLASNGISVVLTARDEKRGSEALEKLRGSGLSDLVVFHQLDVVDPSTIASLADFVTTQFGRLDILSGDQNNLNELITQTYELTKECLETNYYGAKRMIEAFIALLQLSGSPRIVNVSSFMGKLKYIPSERVKGILNDADTLTEDTIDELLNRFLEDFKEKSLETKGWPAASSAYTVSKAAMKAYTRILAKKYPTFRINCVCPGYVRTDINENNGIFSVEEGAEHPVRLALLLDDGPTGVSSLFRKKYLLLLSESYYFQSLIRSWKYAIVAGANKGIGFEICRQLASNGIMVVLTARDEKRGTETLEKLKGFGLSDRLVFHQLDVANSSSIASFADFIKTQFGRLDVLYIPSEWAKGELNDAEGLTEERIKEVLKVFLKDFKDGSVETKGWPPLWSAYTVSKASLNSYTRILAKKYPTFRINCVCPGYVKTDINSKNGKLGAEEGVASVVTLALVPKDGPSGLFFDQKEVASFVE